MSDRIFTKAKIQRPTYEGILWAGFAIGLSFVSFRLWVRQKTLKKFFSDDYVIILALFSYLLTAALQQTQLDHMYQLYAAARGEIAPNIEWMDGQTTLLHHVIGFNVLFYMGLYMIKMSFMLFFRRLEGGVTKHRYWWWAVLSVTLATWVVCIGTIQWECLAYNVAKNPQQYQICGTDAKVSYQQMTFRMNCAFDVTTDFLIISIPVALLWNRRIPVKKKAALIGLFSLTVLIMVIAIIRVVLVSSRNVPSDMTWLYVWSDIEFVVALIVSSLASFRQLYMSGQPEHTGKPQHSPNGGYRNGGSLPSFVNRFASAKRTTRHHTEITNES